MFAKFREIRAMRYVCSLCRKPLTASHLVIKHYHRARCMWICPRLLLDYKTMKMTQCPECIRNAKLTLAAQNGHLKHPTSSSAHVDDVRRSHAMLSLECSVNIRSRPHGELPHWDEFHRSIPQEVMYLSCVVQSSSIYRLRAPR